MGFVEIEKAKKNTGRRGPAAKYSVNKKGSGNLRINTAGMEFLARNKVLLKPKDRVKIFYDGTTGRLALKKSFKGKFTVTKSDVAGKSLRIAATELAKQLGSSQEYDLAQADGFALLFIPKS